jgi:arylsulfatase A-like enzyme
MKHRILPAIVFLIGISALNAQSPSTPKLVVGIVVDQMRPDYVYRYWNKFGNGGFRRLYNEGYNCRNTQYPYMPTYTGPGHASIYSGTTPALHGIVGNNWFDRAENKSVYCTQDTSAQCTGCTSVEGKMSPGRLLTSTITDELEIATRKQAKVIGISIKDRGAILPAGHAADAAYWYDGSTGNFVSSTWYLSQLPQWTNDFNERRWPDQYLAKPWTTLLPIETYKESDADNSPYEAPFATESAPVFPHAIPTIPGGYDRLRRIPAGNTFTKDFALAALQGEQMGKDSVTDFLCLSFSCTDYVGHQFGTQAIETEDTYIRLDRDLNDLFNFLDKNIGKGNYLLFLTADHGAVENPQFLRDQKIPAGFGNDSAITDSVKAFLTRSYGSSNYFVSILNDQIHLNHKAINSDRRNRCEVANNLSAYIHETFPQFQDVISACQLEQADYTALFRSKMQKGYKFGRSGDVWILNAPGYVDRLYGGNGKQGTTHGAPYPYDAHVPLYWMGWNIPKGNTTREIQITDIASTLALMLNIPFPNACTGKPISEIIK